MTSPGHTDVAPPFPPPQCMILQSPTHPSQPTTASRTTTFRAWTRPLLTTCLALRKKMLPTTSSPFPTTMTCLRLPTKAALPYTTVEHSAALVMTLLAAHHLGHHLGATLALKLCPCRVSVGRTDLVWNSIQEMCTMFRLNHSQ